MRAQIFLAAVCLTAWSCRSGSSSANLESQARKEIQRIGATANLADRRKHEDLLYGCGPAAIEPIQAAVATPEYSAKPELVAVLSAIPDPRVPDLLLQLAQSQDPDVARQALQGIAMPPRKPIPGPVFKLGASPDPGIREWMLYAVGRQGATAGRGYALGWRSDENLYIRRQCARFLGICRDSQSREALTKLANDEEGVVRLEGAISLSRQDPGHPYVIRAIQSVSKSLANASPADKIEGARILGQFPTPAAEKELAAFLGDPDPRVRAVAAQSYGRLGKAARFGPLSKSILKDPDMKVRVSAAGSISRLDLPGNVAALKSLLLSKDRTLMLLAAEAAVAMRNSEAAGAYSLMEKLPSTEMQRYGAIGRMNTGMGDGKFFRVVDGIFADAGAPEPDKREEAAGLLALMPGPKAEAALRKLSGDSDEKVRRAAMRSLKQRVRMPFGIPPVQLHPLPSWRDFPD